MMYDREDEEFMALQRPDGSIIADILIKPKKEPVQQVLFEGGAKRCDTKAAHFLTPLELIEAVGRTRFEGDAKYEPGNWQKGDRIFFVDCLSHAVEHLFSFPWDDSEDHLGHAACNIAFILWGLKNNKVSREDFVNYAKLKK